MTATATEVRLGRPPLPEDVRLSVVKRVRLTTSDSARLDALAAAGEADPGDVLRAVIRSGLHAIENSR